MSLPALPEGRPWVLGRGISREGAGQAVCVECVGCSSEEKRVWRALSAAELSAVFSVSVNSPSSEPGVCLCQNDPCGAAIAICYFRAIAVWYFRAIAICCCSKN